MVLYMEISNTLIAGFICIHLIQNHAILQSSGLALSCTLRGCEFEDQGKPQILCYGKQAFLCSYREQFISFISLTNNRDFLMNVL